MLARYARFSTEHPVLLLTIVAVVTAVLGACALTIRVSFYLEDLFRSGDPTRQAYAEFREAFGADDNFLCVAFQREDVFDAEGLEILDRLTEDLRKVEYVGAVYSIAALRRSAPARMAQLLPGWNNPAGFRRQVLDGRLFVGNLVSADGRTAGVILELRDEVRERRVQTEAVQAVREALARETERSGTEFHLAGVPVIEEEYVRLIRHDRRIFVPLSMGIFVVFLALHFRRGRGVVLPAAAVAIAVVWLLGIMALLDVPIGVLTAIVPNLVIVIGISDAIHLVSRHLEDARRIPDPLKAVRNTVETMAGACFLTSLTTAVGFASLAVTQLHLVRQFGLLAGAGILLAYIASMLFIPPVLALLHHRPPPVRGGRSEEWLQGFLGGVERLNLRRPRMVLASGIVFSILALWGATRIHLSSSWFQDIEQDNEVFRDHAFVEKNLTGVFTVEMVFLASGDAGFADPGALQSLEELGAFLRAKPEVVYVASIADAVTETRRFLAPGKPPIPETVEEAEKAFRFFRWIGGAKDLLDRYMTPDRASCRLTMRVANVDSAAMNRVVAEVEDFLDPLPTGLTAYRFTGKSVMAGTAMGRVIDDMFSTVFLAAGLIFLLMTLLFRSLRVGVLSMGPNIVPILGTMGLMGFADIAVNFSTMTIFSITLGIAVDDTIHFLARYREERRRDLTVPDAVSETIRTAGGAVVVTSVLLLLGFLVLVFSAFGFTRRFGLLAGFTMLVAVCADLFILPPLLLLFARRREADLAAPSDGGGGLPGVATQ